MIDRIICNVVSTLGLCMLMLLTNCKSSHTKKEISDGSIQIKTQLGEDVTTAYNASKSYALLQQIQDPKNIGSKKIHFIVMRVRDSVVVHEGSYMHGYVKWVDDNSLEKLSLPGKVKQDQDMSVYKKIIRIDQATPKL